MRPALLSRSDPVAAARRAGEPKVVSYQFSREILRRVNECRRNDNYHGVLELIEDWAVIAASIYCSLAAWNAGLAVGIPVYCMSIFLIGGRQRALADILHQATHRTLTKNGSLGRVLGTVASGYLVFQSFTGYRASHVRQHHAFLGDPERDPDYRQYQMWNICGANRTALAVRSHLLRLFTPATTIRYLLHLIRYRVCPVDEDITERVFRLSFIVAVAGVICGFGYGRLLLLFWLLPLVTAQAWIGAFLELVEHFPMINWRSQFDIGMSRNRRCGWFSSFMLGLKQYDGYHLVHHKFPFIPSWRLTEVHHILMEDETYRSMNQTYGWRAILKTILAPEGPEETNDAGERGNSGHKSVPAYQGS